MEIDKIYLGDCLELMKEIPDKSIDCIICDLPYGTTACAWDSIIPFDKLWAEYKRIRKPNAPILLFGSEPFSTMIRMSNLSEFRYDWIWEKSQGANFVHAKIKPLKFLDDYHIYYERTDRGIRLENSDIPSAEVKGYYIKESAYYDQVSATFHTKVQAICPILSRDDDFGGKATKYPLFWVKYSDIAPFLAKQTIMTSNLNNAATMSVDDYFTMNKYKGKIYKTNNMLGKTLAQMAMGKNDSYDAMDEAASDSIIAKEQKRIEKQIKDFEANIWGDQARKDSLDSIAKLDPKVIKAEKKKNRREQGVSAAKSSSNTKVKKPRRSSTVSSSSAARVTVRRQRH